MMALRASPSGDDLFEAGPRPFGGTPPLHLTEFIGREQELDRLREALASTRLLTLTGAGGSGKSRLAAELVSRPGALPVEEMRWLELASVAAGEMLPVSAVAALGIQDRGDANPLVLIANFLRGPRTLLVLDNCEHLLDDCVQLAEFLLRQCPALRIMATSREPLGIPGELAWLVPPLAVPPEGSVSVDEAQRSEATRLFVTRVRSLVPGFALGPGNVQPVSQICRQLGGLPLALELAAARVKVLAPEQIAARLADVFSLLTSGTRTGLPRHRTLRAAMDWSYDLLHDRERRLLRRVTVFNGSFCLDAAEAVCADAQLTVDEVLDSLSALVDKSLVSVLRGDAEARYRLLEPVRQYAAERLSEEGATAAFRRRHAEHFLALVEAAEPHIFAAGQNEEWIRRLAAEEDNVRAAFDWALAEPDRRETALRFAASLHWYWFAQGLYGEAKQRTDQALATRAEVNACARARALIARGQIAFWRGDEADLLPPMRESIELLRSVAAPRDLAYALACVGTAHALAGDLPASDAAFAESVVLAEALKDAAALTTFILFSRGRIASINGNHSLARACYEKGLACGRTIGADLLVGHVLAGLGRLDLKEGLPEAAAAHLAESLRLHRLTRDPWGIALGLMGLARAAGPVRPEHGAVLLGAAAALRERMGVRLLAFRVAEQDALLSTLRSALGEVRLAQALEAGAALDLEAAVALALAESHADVGPIPPPQPPALAATTPPASAATDDAPLDLRVLALGPLEIECRGRAIEPVAWRSGKPRELLVLLLVHRGGMTRDEVGLAFWPDASASEVKNNFHVTLHRLRQVLQHASWIRQVGDRYRIAPELRVSFDVARFEEDVTSTLRSLARGDGADATGVLEAALAQYRGDFGAGERFGAWHDELRDRLSRLYTEGLLAWAGRAVDADRLAQAAEAYQRVLARDSLNEAAYRGLMLTFARQGERARALRLFQQLSALLRAELDTEPSPETVRLHHTLQNG